MTTVLGWEMTGNDWGDTLVVNVPGPADMTALEEASGRALTYFFTDYSLFRNANPSDENNASFGTAPPAEPGKWATVVLYHERNKPRFNLLTSIAADAVSVGDVPVDEAAPEASVPIGEPSVEPALEPVKSAPVESDQEESGAAKSAPAESVAAGSDGSELMSRTIVGTLLVSGRNKAGAKSASKSLKETFTQIDKVQMGRHCSVFRATQPKEPSERASLSVATEVQQDAPAFPGAYVAYPGVFNRGKLDDGTRLLLEVFKPRRGSRLLDMCCGIGTLGIAASHRDGAALVHMVDNDAFAVESALENAERHAGCETKVFASNAFGEVKGRFDTIVCNPPFHQGVATSNLVAEQIIAKAPFHLGRRGELWLVANRFLKYQPLLQAAFGTVDIIADDGRFRVYRAVPLYFSRDPSLRERPQ